MIDFLITALDIYSSKDTCWPSFAVAEFGWIMVVKYQIRADAQSQNSGYSGSRVTMLCFRVNW